MQSVQATFKELLLTGRVKEEDETRQPSAQHSTASDDDDDDDLNHNVISAPRRCQGISTTMMVASRPHVNKTSVASGTSSLLTHSHSHTSSSTPFAAGSLGC